MRTIKYSFLTWAALLIACTTDDALLERYADACELEGVQTIITGGSPVAMTRAIDKVTTLKDTIGRKVFIAGDKVVFTDIRRTENAYEDFTYPGKGTYEGVVFEAGSEGGWTRVKGSEEPDRIYWTDAKNPHTFIAYSIPQNADFDWSHTQATAQEKAYYQGTLGKTTDTEIVYASAKDLEHEDLLLSYSKEVMAEPGGNVALVKFQHAMSNVRVVVNINGFSAGKEAADNKTLVSNMLLLHQPTDYIWMQANAGVHPLTVQPNTTITRKNVKLWIPNNAGVGSDQNRTFTFYGITTPQPSDYLSTLPESDEGRKVELQFDVTYPNPLNPSENLTKPYKASMSNVYFEAGYNTTINITLNHRDEQMVVGAEYKNWEYVAAPEEGELIKNSTFLQSVERKSVTIVGDEKATADDATWLYMDGNVMKDIYGNDGTKGTPYQISTADQLLSFAYEVKAGRTFEEKYVRLDADLTLQMDNGKSNLNWLGIGDVDHVFNGTFLGGDRYINRLAGSPLFVKLGENAVVEQLHITTVGTISGHGALADSNAGIVGGCKVIDDVNTTGGALVGTNSGTIHACYYTGSNDVPLVGSGTTVGCYVAKDITSFHEAETKVGELNLELDDWYNIDENKSKYKSQFKFVHSPGNYPTVEKK